MAWEISEEFKKALPIYSIYPDDTLEVDCFDNEKEYNEGSHYRVARVRYYADDDDWTDAYNEIRRHAYSQARCRNADGFVYYRYADDYAGIQLKRFSPEKFGWK